MKKLILSFVVFLTGCAEEGYIGKALDAIEPDYYSCSVMRVIKGDIFYCQTTNRDVLKVKLMGVEIGGTNEDEAKKFTESLLPIRTNVWVSISNSRKGEGGTTEAFVYLQDKTFLNGYLISKGYGYESFDSRQNKYKKKFDEVYYNEKSSLDEKDEISPDESDRKPPWLR